MRQPSRRRFLTTSLAAGAAAALAACGYREPGKENTTWRYTDDRNRTATAGRTPERIVAQVAAAAALWDFGVHATGIFGPSTLPNGKQDPLSGSIDLDEVTSLGSVWGEFDYDKYLSLNPELLVSVMYLKDELWYVPEKYASDIEDVAPTVGLYIGKLDAPQCIRKFEQLAGALGADLDSGSIRAAKTRYEKATSTFSGAVRSVADQRVLVVAAQQDHLYVANPAAFPTTRYFTDRGMNIVVPEQTQQDGYYQELSWENAGKYRADIIMYDNRTSSLKPEQLTDNPTWSELPAVRAGRLIPWASEIPLSYQHVGAMLEELGAALNRLELTS